MTGRIAHKLCDECGQVMAKAKRVENGFAYCSTCYERIFKPATCVRCGEPMRAHKNDANPTCRNCIRAERTCFRCGKLTPRAYLSLGKKVLCDSCAPHFRIKHPCQLCGRESSRLTRLLVSGQPYQACEQCKNQDFATCSVCRRYRKIMHFDDLLRPICVDCGSSTPITHSCPDCGSDTPGGGHSPCQACSLERRINKRTRLNSELFEEPWCRALFESFCQWEGLPRKAGNMTKRIDSYARFFWSIEKHIDNPNDITLDSLFKIFQADGLRKGFLPVTFLIDVLHLEWSPEKLEELTERRRINQLLETWESKPWLCYIQDYLKYLKNKRLQNGSQLRQKTIRTYINAASHLLEIAKSNSTLNISSNDVETLLKKKPGLIASLNPYLTYLNDLHNCEIKRPIKYRKFKTNEKEVVAKVRSFMNRLDSTTKDSEARALIASTISMLYQLQMKNILSLKWKDVEIGNSTTTLTIGEELINLHPKVSFHFKRWLHTNSHQNGYVFKGRNPAQPLSHESVRYFEKSPG